MTGFCGPDCINGFVFFSSGFTVIADKKGVLEGDSIRRQSAQLSIIKEEDVGAFVLVGLQDVARLLIAIREPINGAKVFGWYFSFSFKDCPALIIPQEIKNSYDGFVAVTIPQLQLI